MPSLELKACPRCNGTIETNEDMYGNYKLCLQCGYMEDLDTEEEMRDNLREAGGLTSYPRANNTKNK